MNKPHKKEIAAALILCIALLLGTVAYTNNLKESEYLGGTNLIEPQWSDSRRALEEQYGLPGPTTQTSTIDDGRIRDIRQWIKGELKNGTFEEVVTSIEEETENLNGYIDSEDITYTQDLWSGEIVSKIPQNNSLKFVFKARNLISTNGKVISITTNIKDITPQTGTTAEKPPATIRVTLKEIQEKTSPPGLPQVEFPLLAAIGPYLSTFFSWVITGVVIGLPAYFTILGIIMLIDRALIPLASKLFKKA